MKLYQLFVHSKWSASWQIKYMRTLPVSNPRLLRLEGVNLRRLDIQFTKNIKMKNIGQGVFKNHSCQLQVHVVLSTYQESLLKSTDYEKIKLKGSFIKITKSVQPHKNFKTVFLPEDC